MRLVLGRISAPPALLEQQAVALPAGAAWPYWFKVGMVVRSGLKKVTISVPPKWRSRVAIAWGSAWGGQASVVLEACKDSRSRWFAYAGGFYLSAPSACVPLEFRVGKDGRGTVRFGIGEPCP